VLSLFLINLYNGGTYSYGFTAFFKPIVDEFHWSYTAFSFAASLRGIEIGLAAPFLGFLVDRLGPRRLIFGGVLLVGVGFFLLSTVTSLISFYCAMIVLAIGHSTCASTVTMTAVANWFKRKVGIATGLMMSGYGASGILIPVVTAIIDSYGWREALAIFAFGAWMIAIPLYLIIRDKPEQYGYLPDGVDKIVKINGGTEVDTTTKGALSTRIFWFIGVAMCLQHMAQSAVILHLMPHLEEVGVIRPTAALVVALLPLISIIGRLIFGWAGDLLDKRHVLTVSFVLQGIGIFVLSYAYTIPLLILFLTTFAIGYGGSIPLRASIQREYFGRSSFGRIQGMMTGLRKIGGIIAPTFAGWVFDAQGNYHTAWLVFFGLNVLAAPIILTAPKVTRAPYIKFREGCTKICSLLRCV